MAYRAAVTEIPGGSFRPWASRLGDVGDYRRATYYVPTSTIPYGNQPVTGGLGMDLSSLVSSPSFWLGLGVVAMLYLNWKKR